jgi:hypothetical protein
MKEKITKEHRLLDDTDLNNINNTFKLIEKTCDNIQKEIGYLRWVVGFLVAGVITIIFKLYT